MTENAAANQAGDPGSGTSDPTPREPREETLRALVGSCPTPVWALAGLFALVLFGYSFLFPAYQAPDEPQHTDMVLMARGDPGYRDPEGAFISQRVIESLPEALYAQGRDLLASDAEPRADRPTFQDLGTLEPSEVVNQQSQHPPLYYGLFGAVSTAVTTFIPGADTWSYDRSLGLLRLLNIPFLAALVPLCWAAARRAGATASASVAAAVFPLAIPQLAHIGSSVNNDNLLVFLFGLLTVLAVRVAGGDLSKRTAVVSGVVLGLALFTKGFALIAPVWIVLVYLVARGATVRVVGSRVAMVAGVSFVAGGWWWLRNIIVFGTLQPSRQQLADAPDFQPDVGVFAERYVDWMSARFWGWFGWFDVRLDPVFTTTATVIGLALVAVGCVALLRRWPMIVALATPFVLLFVIWAQRAYSGHARTGSFPGIQGRYLFPAVVGLGVLLGIGLCRLMGRTMPYASIVLLGGAAVLHGAAAVAILDHYWGGPGATVPDRLHAVAAWSPWPAFVTITWALAATVGGVFTVVLLARFALDQRAAVPRGRDVVAAFPDLPT